MVRNLSALARQKRAEDSTPISFKETLEVVNHFVVQTTQFLNHFAVVCEEKLQKVDKDLTRLEITLSLLESKLQSIDGIAAPAAATAPPAATSLPTVDNNNTSSGAPPPPPPPPGTGAPAPPPPPPAPVEDSGPKVPKCKDDPRLAEFFKLLRIGAAKAQIENKMAVAIPGIDISVLE